MKLFRLKSATHYVLPVAASLAIFGCGKKDQPAPAEGTPAAQVEGKTDGEKPAEAKTEGETPVDGEKPVDETPTTPERLTGPVASVNGVAIPAEAFYEEVDKITARGAQIPADRVARIEHNILKRLIEQELINQAVKSSEVVVSAEDIAAGFEEYKKRFQDDEQFENYLKHGRVTKESIEARIRDRRSLELLLEKQGDLVVADEEAKAFFEKNERFYTDKAGLRASHILVKVLENAPPEEEAKAQAKVKEAQERLKKGEAFDVVARELGEGPAAEKGGDLGFFSEGRMVKEFEDVAFKMKVDEVSAPVRTRFGFHIIKVTEKREDRKKPFEEVKDQIVKSLQNKKFFTERRKLLADLEKNAKVEKFLPEPPPIAPNAAEHMGPGDHPHGPDDGHGHGPNDGHNHGPQGMPPGVVPPPGGTPNGIVPPPGGMHPGMAPPVGGVVPPGGMPNGMVPPVPPPVPAPAPAPGQ